MEKLSVTERFDINSKANGMMDKMEKYVNDWELRINSSTEQFFRIHGGNHPEMWELYKQIYCNTSSTAAVERSFSVQNYLQTPRRNRLSEGKLSSLMFINITLSLASEYGYVEDICKYIELDGNVEIL